jgi:3-hydroxyacyl-CoA dehydrogenase/enoyl-CoA hydratase/3-hydroxybutyryl-CoA epimerase/3-hydroxyacyl-CoA dehydrogenase/enoyl-CoA hydratase/3-hydroxybutyryl-CoA epimerase/enoyl-CoA isomerase
MAPIVVRDGPGFLLNRLLVPYMNEALELLLDGASVEALDQAALEFGMPLGPLAHFDEFGIDVALAVGRTLYWAFPDRIVPSELLIAMYKAGHWGRKSGSGFYVATQDSGAARQLAPGIRHMISERQRGQQCFSTEEITRRLFLPVLLEANRVLEERLVEGPAIIDIALRDGLGMTESYRGLFGWAESIGVARLLDWLQPLRPLGKRFEPTQLLLSKVCGR